MKRLFVLPFMALLSLSFQASACLLIKDTYSGTIPANGTAYYGPFTIGSTCTMANIASTIAALGAGSPPQLYIEKLSGSSWVQVAGGTGTTASYLGALGTFRVKQVNTTTASESYSGTTSYGH